MPDEVPNWVVDTQPARTSDDGSGWVIGGRYRIADRLGTGGTAEVFRAHDELLDRDVAVKVFRTPPCDDDALFSAARRDAELQSLARLNHPNLIRLLDGALGCEGPSYLVLDLVCGPDLATKLQDGPLPEPEVRAIGRQIAGALDYAHAQGMVHRDVKPANILLGSDGPDGDVWARLSDFGTVLMVDGARLTAADLTLGTASYIAPEQARGADVGPAADVYSLGLVLMEALTGKRCFDGAPHEALAARLASTPAVPDWLAEDLKALLTAMTATDPELRPTAGQVAESLQAAIPAAVVAAADTEATSSLRPVAIGAAAAAAAAPGAAAEAAPAEAAPSALASADPSAGPVAARPDANEAQPADGKDPSDSRRPRGSALLFALAGLALAALVAGALILVMSTSPASDGQTPPARHRSAEPVKSHTHHPRTKEAGVEVGVQQPSVRNTPSPTRTAPTTTAPATTRHQVTSSSRPVSSSATTSAVVSSSAPASSSSTVPASSSVVSSSTATATTAAALASPSAHASRSS